MFSKSLPRLYGSGGGTDAETDADGAAVAAAARSARPLMRASDDFYPRDRASHAPHLYANAYIARVAASLG